MTFSFRISFACALLFVALGVAFADGTDLVSFSANRIDEIVRSLDLKPTVRACLPSCNLGSCKRRCRKSYWHRRRRRRRCYRGCDSRCRVSYACQVKADAMRRQQARAAALRNRILLKTGGVMLSPGDRGTLGHKKRCSVASDARVNELLRDHSDRLWKSLSPLAKAALASAIGPSAFSSIGLVRKIEAQCKRISSRIQRINFIDRLGGKTIDKVFKKSCALQNHLEGVAEDGLLDVIKLLFDTPAGEYVSLLFNKIIKLKWPSTVDYCSLVCRKNRRGIHLKRCVIGCAETLLPNCWSQCDLYTCKRGCKNGFWHRRRARRRCYRRCDSKCTLSA